jgi:hypothetical protein
MSLAIVHSSDYSDYHKELSVCDLKKKETPDETFFAIVSYKGLVR